MDNTSSSNDTFIFKQQWHRVLRQFSPRVRCEVFDAVMQYCADGTVGKLSTAAAVAFAFIREEIDAPPSSQSSPSVSQSSDSTDPSDSPDPSVPSDSSGPVYNDSYPTPFPEAIWQREECLWSYNAFYQLFNDVETVKKLCDEFRVGKRKLRRMANDVLREWALHGQVHLSESEAYTSLLACLRRALSGPAESPASLT